MQLTEYQAVTLELALRDTNAGSPLVGLLADLTKTDVPITQATTLAELDAAKANYAGYAQGVVTWDLPTVTSANEVEVVGTMPVWRPTDAVTPNNIYQVYFQTDVTGVLAFAATIDGAPFPMGSALNQLILMVRYRPQTNSLIVTLV